MCSLCKVYLQHNSKHKMINVIALVETMILPQNKSSNKIERDMLTQEK